MDVVSSYYLWIKAVHIIAVIAWMAGLLYLPRLFVYHTDVAEGSEASATFKVMERKLLKIIMNPAMIVVFVTGALLIVNLGSGAMQAGWLHAKFILVVVLAGMHGMLAKWLRMFESDRNARSGRFYRIINEVPTLLMIGIVVLAVVRPF